MLKRPHRHAELLEDHAYVEVAVGDASHLLSQFSLSDEESLQEAGYGFLQLLLLKVVDAHHEVGVGRLDRVHIIDLFDVLHVSGIAVLALHLVAQSIEEAGNESKSREHPPDVVEVDLPRLATLEHLSGGLSLTLGLALALVTITLVLVAETLFVLSLQLLLYLGYLSLKDHLKFGVDVGQDFSDRVLHVGRLVLDQFALGKQQSYVHEVVDVRLLQLLSAAAVGPLYDLALVIEHFLYLVGSTLVHVLGVVLAARVVT